MDVTILENNAEQRTLTTEMDRPGCEVIVKGDSAKARIRLFFEFRGMKILIEPRGTDDQSELAPS